MTCILCNDAHLAQDDNQQWQIIGDPTEGALLSLAGKVGLDKPTLNSKIRRVAEFPFDTTSGPSQ